MTAQDKVDRLARESRERLESSQNAKWPEHRHLERMGHHLHYMIDAYYNDINSKSHDRIIAHMHELEVNLAKFKAVMCPETL